MTTESQQHDYIQAHQEWTALEAVCKIDWLPWYLRITLARYTKIAQRKIK